MGLMIAGSIITVIRIIFGVAMIAGSVALIIFKHGTFLAVIGFIVMLVLSWSGGLEALAGFWGWSTANTRNLMMLVFGGAIFLALCDLELLSSLIGGIGGIIAGLLTMGVFGAAAADALLEIGMLPMLGLAAVMLIVIFILSGGFGR